MDTTTNGIYRAQIVPALHDIQHEHGYLKREALELFSKESGIPLYRIQAVASFFPHFRVTPPPVVTLRVCRDMACHLAGSGEMLKELGGMADGRVAVEGTSCLGRCDRAPAACAALHQHAHGGNGAKGPKGAKGAKGTTGEGGHLHDAGGERYYYGRSAEQLKQMLRDSVENGRPLPPSDTDADRVENGRQRYPGADWMIDPYKGKEPTYAAVDKAIGLRRESLRRAADALRGREGWTDDKVELFRVAATLGRWDLLDEAMTDALKDWQTEDDWAKRPDLGGWAEALLKELDDAHADLRGMGGAGIPATQKWRDVRDAVRTARRRGQDDRAFIVVNGDESEPATFKDRELLLHCPHVVIEGVILAGLIAEASQGFIYIRHEYPEQIEACNKEIERARKAGVFDRVAAALGRPFPVSVFVSPGGYICGEQSALIEAMSDRRGEPRNMPPKLETNGLLDRPTLVSNVETYSWAPFIVLNGGEAYAKLGVNGWRGRRFFSVCGDVNRPGVYEVPMGMTLRELIEGEQYCQGVLGGRKLKAFAPSGPSGGFLPAKLTAKAGLPRDHTKNKSWLEVAKRRGFDPAATELDILDLELELNLFRALSPTQALGAGVCVYAEGRDMAEEAVNSIEFYRNESCGKCVPCRIGSQKLATLGNHLLNGRVDAGTWEKLKPILGDMGKTMELASICGLGRSVPVPLRTAAAYFPDDVNAHLTPAAGNGAAAFDVPEAAHASTAVVEEGRQ